MNRRQFFVSLPALTLASQVLAHHGWSSFDEARPLYFEGVVKTIKWQNPHAEITITMANDAVLPSDLAKRNWPLQTQTLDSKKIATTTTLPTARGEWVLELSPLTRVEAWKVAQPKLGDKIAAIGYTFAAEKKYNGKHMARIEYLILGEKIYGLRSMPA
jgi:Family of unknown function (DUF6152)